MSNPFIFPPLTDWEPTRHTLHLYSRVVGTVPRTHAPFHPQWWHISLKVTPDGLTTDAMPLPTEGGETGGEFWLTMNLRRHVITVETNESVWREFDMRAGLSATEMGDQVLSALAELGLEGEYARAKFESDEPLTYDPAAVERFRDALFQVDRIFKEHRATLDRNPGPVQLWPHGFDLAFEWFGSKEVEHEENGKVERLPSQLNLGFYPGDAGNAAYFYSNPWPFESAVLLAHPLPPGAFWFTDGWQGSVLPYAELTGDPAGEARLREYARSVYAIARPTLMKATD